MTATQTPEAKEATMSITTVGEFTYDPTTGAVSGPASFMRSSDYAAWRSRFESGTDTVFSFGAAHIGEPGYAASFEVAMLVSLQTCYAGWHGAETFNRMRGVA